MKKILAKCYIWILLILLYAPILFIAVFSFTESKVLGNWTGFSTQLYTNLFTGSMHSDAGCGKHPSDCLDSGRYLDPPGYRGCNRDS